MDVVIGIAGAIVGDWELGGLVGKKFEWACLGLGGTFWNKHWYPDCCPKGGWNE